MNCKSEIDILKEENYSGVNFLPTTKTIEYFVGKKLININAMIDIARNQNKDLLLINSDIELSELPILKNDGITIFSRLDYEEIHTKENAKMFIHGFDMFYIPAQFLTIFPPSIYGMGAAWWDVWLPNHAILKGVPLYYPKGRFCFHKVHPTQYDYEQWIYLSKYFQWEFKIDPRLNGGQIATMAMANIRKKLIVVV